MSMKSSNTIKDSSAGSGSRAFFSKGQQSDFFSQGGDGGGGGFFTGGGMPVQTKLTVGEPDDVYEKEADQMAEKVVRSLHGGGSAGGEAGAIQEKPMFGAAGAIREKPTFGEKRAQRKCAACEEEEHLQKKDEDMTSSGDTASPGRPVPSADTPSLEQALQSSKGGGSPLPAGTKQQMESSFGTDFSQVRIHQDSNAVQMSRDLHAQAFTHGSDIYFNAGKYDPGSREGQGLLAHELTHTIQQAGMIQRVPACGLYEPGEEAKSMAAGVLKPPVIPVSPGVLLIADFPVGRSDIKPSVLSNAAFQANLAQFKSDCAFRFVIVGFSDCIGVEDSNINLRQQRALKVEQLLGAGAKERVSFRGMAALGMFVTTNDTPENRAKNRSTKLEFRKGFFGQSEAIANATASDVKLREALAALGASNEMREKNVPDYIAKLGITLETLTPRHDADVSAPTYNLFTGKTNYATTVNLPGTVRFHSYAGGTRIAIPVRKLPCVDPFLSMAQIKERIVQAITERAHINTEGGAAAPLFEIYRSRFQGWWNIAPFNLMSGYFDPNMDSKGPRTRRSREIFNKIYSGDVDIKNAYDLNTGGVREKIDKYFGPDALNLINSARLHELKKAFDTHAAPVPDAGLPAFKATIQAAAARLDANDIDAFNKSGEWSQLIARYFTRENVRTEVIELIRTSAPAPPAPAPPPVPAPAAGGAGAARTFLNKITIDGPVVPVASDLEKEPVVLTPKSDRNNPGVVFNTRMTITPAVKVIGPNVSPVAPWPVGSKFGAAFVPEISVNATANMNAHLDVEGLPAALSAGLVVPDLPFTVTDHRLAFILANWSMDFQSTAPAGKQWFNAVHPVIRYEHGAQDFGVSGVLNVPNPGLTLSIKARVKRGGVIIASNAVAQAWPSGAQVSPPVSLPFAPPGVIPAGGDPLVVEADLLDASGTVLGTKHANVNVLAPAVYTEADAIAVATEDAAHLNSAAFLNLMAAQGALAARVAAAIRTPEADGGVVLRPLTIRHDSEAYVNLKLGGPNPAYVGWFLGTSYANSAAWPSGAAAMNIAPRFGFAALGNRLLVANRTTDVANRVKRTDLELIPLIVHEAVHALDLPESVADIYRYQTEFRAYWMDGRYGPPFQANCPLPAGGCKEVFFDPNMLPPGPKSPRAREIFNFLYGNNSYAFVKPAYDTNAGGFRDMVDNLLVPDGIDLIASVRLERLRMLINGYAGADFPGTKSKIRKMAGTELPAPPGGALDAEELREIRGNREWRDLVEKKFPAGERNDIKRELGIPL